MKCLFVLLQIRILWRFAPIFYFNCEHFLFVYIVKQKRISQILSKKLLDFQNFQKSNFLEGGKFLKIGSSISFLWVKILARLVQSFRRLLDTNNQTSKVYI